MYKRFKPALIKRIASDVSPPPFQTLRRSQRSSLLLPLSRALSRIHPAAASEAGRGIKQRRRRRRGRTRTLRLGECGCRPQRREIQISPNQQCRGRCRRRASSRSCGSRSAVGGRRRSTVMRGHSAIGKRTLKLDQFQNEISSLTK